MHTAKDYIEASDKKAVQNMKADDLQELTQGFLEVMNKGGLIRVPIPPEGFKWLIRDDGEVLVDKNKNTVKLSDVVFEQVYKGEGNE